MHGRSGLVALISHYFTKWWQSHNRLVHISMDNISTNNVRWQYLALKHCNSTQKKKEVKIKTKMGPSARSDFSL